jgi:hypothetical protein
MTPSASPFPDAPSAGPTESAPPLAGAPGGPHCAGCCGPIGGDGQINSELFVRGGPSLPVAGGFFNKLIDTGWMSEVGGRSLFFNVDDDAAWTAELSLSYTYNNGNRPNQVVNFGTGGGGDPASVSTLNRTFGNFALGREVYLRGLAHQEGFHWRAGADLGLRYGTDRLDLHDYLQGSNYERVNKWGYGWVASLHTDLEMPCGCCTWVVGFRAEIDQDYAHQLFAGQKSYLTDVNLLGNIGVRY